MQKVVLQLEAVEAAAEDVLTDKQQVIIEPCFRSLECCLKRWPWCVPIGYLILSAFHECDIEF